MAYCNQLQEMEQHMSAPPSNRPGKIKFYMVRISKSGQIAEGYCGLVTCNFSIKKSMP